VDDNSDVHWCYSSRLVFYVTSHHRSGRTSTEAMFGLFHNDGTLRQAMSGVKERIGAI
jgi:hypothetical protein